MNNLLFKKWNDFSGWIVFLIAAFVYGMTIEPTASFWDCPEFISCAEKLQVGHPPGAPFYMLVGNLFTQFASEASHVSWLVNFLNALLSAGCILFLFWSITRLVRSLIVNEEHNLSTIDVIVILGSGFVGALAYTFSDTFWFSAVEGEVYAFSSFLTALVFWMILRWQDESDSVYGDRWIILIAYIIGLSIGVHLLNLLCIPAIVLVFYYQKYHAISFKGVAAAIVISGLLIVFILFVYIPGIADMGGWFELLFVNVFGLPFHTGLIVFLTLTFLVLVGAIYRFRKRMLHTSLWCLLMLTVGYTTYAVILIRANANTPLNENAPDNIFTLKSYLNREQYESAPLLYGKTYASDPEYVPEGDYYRVKTTKGSAVYRPDKEKGKYKIIRYKEDVCYTQNMLFPRMWNERMAASYKNWTGGSEAAPTQKENLTYFITYQLNYMYWRYFLWNFVGRQNDVQGSGEPEHGNWITGISWLDNLRLGDQSLLPESLRQNKGHNVFYGLPLLLGRKMLWAIHSVSPPYSMASILPLRAVGMAMRITAILATRGVPIPVHFRSSHSIMGRIRSRKAARAHSRGEVNARPKGKSASREPTNQRDKGVVRLPVKFRHSPSKAGILMWNRATIKAITEATIHGDSNCCQRNFACPASIKGPRE